MKQPKLHKLRASSRRCIRRNIIANIIICLIWLIGLISLHAAELWTLAGINAWIDELDALDDYVGAELIKRLPAFKPARRYYSRLGTKPVYTGNNHLRGAGTARRLNEEAAAFATGEGGHPPIIRGMFQGKQVRVLLIAPKTHLRPPLEEGLCVEIYWSPLDSVPNQRIFSKGRWPCFRRGCGGDWPVYNPEGEGLARGHDYAGFLNPRLPLMQRRRRRIHGKKTPSFYWQNTSEYAPGIITTLQRWLSDPNVDYVLVGHSQGANIAMFLLKQGY